jgi:hypothetical protein
MLVAPVATPNDIVTRLHAELKAVLGSNEIQEQILKLGMLPATGHSREELQQFINSEIERWGCAHQVMTTWRSDAWRPTVPTGWRPTVPGRRPGLWTAFRTSLGDLRIGMALFPFDEGAGHGSREITHAQSARRAAAQSQRAG